MKGEIEESENVKNKDVFQSNFLSQKKIKFRKTITSLSKHESDHDPISVSSLADFGLIDEINLEKKQLARENLLAEALREDHWLVEYSCESDIQAKVEYFIRDTLRVLGYIMEVSIIRGSQIRSGCKADVWLIRTSSGRPSAVCEAKCPTTFNDGGGAKSILLQSNV